MTGKYLDIIKAGGKPKISLFEAIEILVAVWDQVSEDTIKNSFRKAGWIHEEATEYEVLDRDDGIEIERDEPQFLSDDQIIDIVTEGYYNFECLDEGDDGDNDGYHEFEFIDETDSDWNDSKTE